MTGGYFGGSGMSHHLVSAEQHGLNPDGSRFRCLRAQVHFDVQALAGSGVIPRPARRVHEHQVGERELRRHGTERTPGLPPGVVQPSLNPYLRRVVDLAGRHRKKARGMAWENLDDFGDLDEMTTGGFEPHLERLGRWAVEHHLDAHRLPAEDLAGDQEEGLGNTSKRDFLIGAHSQPQDALAPRAGPEHPYRFLHMAQVEAREGGQLADQNRQDVVALMILI